jgi:serine/threonine-protein phosphatase PGAM5
MHSCLWVPGLIVGLAPLVVAAEAPKPPAGIHFVYLVRHGMYDRDSTADDVTGNGLNALGHEQASLVATRLAGLPIRPAALVSSTLRRAVETADDMSTILKLTPVRDSLIQECMPTSDRADYMRAEAPQEIARCDSNLAAAWSRYMTPSPEADRHDILVCHGNVIRWFVSRTIGEHTRRWHAMDIANGSLTILAVRSDGTPRLVMFSDVGHLPVTKQTWTGRGAGWSVPAGR